MSRIVIDVREPFEYSKGHVVCAVNIPLSTLSAGAPELQNTPKDVEVIVYCQSGGRSNAAVRLLTEFGFTNVTNGISQQQVCAAYGLD